MTPRLSLGRWLDVHQHVLDRNDPGDQAVFHRVANRVPLSYTQLGIDLDVDIHQVTRSASKTRNYLPCLRCGLV